jgi:PKD repeat protein
MNSNVKIALVLIMFIGISAVVILIGENYRFADSEQLNSSPINKVTPLTIPGGNVQSDKRSIMGSIIINTTVPEEPSSLPVYRQHYRDGDQFSKNFGDNRHPKPNVTSEEDAQDIAEKVMAQFGGLPPDAQYAGSKTEYAEYQTRSGELIRKEPVMTNVYYRKLIDGRPVSGDKDQINLELGENGELLNIYKSWSNLTYDGNVPIIPAKDAVEKLQLGDTITSWNTFDDDVYINNITPGYHLYGEEGSITEPCWFFIGKTGSGKLTVFEVYARQFANFTATPTSGKTPLTVNFTDTSDTTPTEWLWHFGDGTNATEQNPAHTYTTAGTYNVSLRAWNDLGSDTMEKPFFVTVRDPAAPVANFTGTPTAGPAPLTVSFNDTSTNAPTGWLWSFGDGTNATEQNLVHTYVSPGNYTVSLNATNDDGTGSITKPDYITVTDLPPTTLTTQPTTTVTTTVTTTITTAVTTTQPTPTTTHAPLPPTLAIVGIVSIGMLYAIGQRKNR